MLNYLYNELVVFARISAVIFSNDCGSAANSVRIDYVSINADGTCGYRFSEEFDIRSDELVEFYEFMKNSGVTDFMDYVGVGMYLHLRTDARTNAMTIGQHIFIHDAHGHSPCGP